MPAKLGQHPGNFDIVARQKVEQVGQTARVVPVISRSSLREVLALPGKIIGKPHQGTGRRAQKCLTDRPTVVLGQRLRAKQMPYQMAFHVL